MSSNKSACLLFRCLSIYRQRAERELEYIAQKSSKKKNDFKVHTFTENLNSSELKTCYSFCFFSTYDSFIHQTPPKCSQDSTCSEWRAPFIDRCNFDRTRDNLLIIMSGKKSASRTLTTIWLTDKKDCECDSWQVHAMHIIISSFFQCGQL